jgi:FAD:protein FMN transferase
VIALPLRVSPDDLVEPGPLETRHELRGETMGTTWSVSLHVPEEVEGQAVQAEIERALERLVSQMSHWRADSALSGYNRAAAGQWVDAPPEFLRVLESGLDIARLSEGAFDPALGAAVDRWGFGPSGRRDLPPPHSPAPLHGWRDIRVDSIRRRALQPGGVQLDFSSIAKGFAVDHVSAAIEQLGASSYLVEIGGELRGRGVKPGGHPWWVAIEAPPGCPLRSKVGLCGIAIATSGGYRKNFTHGGRSYTHTLDPRSRAPLVNPPDAVSVIHASCMEADAWSTALMVSGVDQGIALCRQFELAALFVVRETAGWRAVASPAFGAMLN